jgi:hypothetical protein
MGGSMRTTALPCTKTTGPLTRRGGASGMQRLRRVLTLELRMHCFAGDAPAAFPPRALGKI